MDDDMDGRRVGVVERFGEVDEADVVECEPSWVILK